MGSLNPMTFALLVLALVVARRSERGPEEVAPGGGTGTSGVPGGVPGGTGAAIGIKPASMPSFLEMSRSDATAWATFFGLTAEFEKSGSMVVHQAPKVGAPVPNHKKVELELGDPRHAS
jgi:hypothetical protein